MKKLSFDEWMKVVDYYIAHRCGGLTHEDLPDYLYHDAWEDGTPAPTAARRAVRAARDF